MIKISSAIGISSAIHIFVGVLLTLSISPSVHTPEVQVTNPAPIIQATMIEASEVQQQIDKIKDEKRRKAQAEADKRAKEKKAREEAVARKRAADKKAKEQAEAERKRKEDERRKKEKEEKAKEEAEQKRLQEEKERQEAAENAEQERLMQEQLQKEQAVRAQAKRKQVLSEIDKYQALIKQTIQRSWRKEDYMRGKYCRLNIRLASNGLVTQLKVLEGDDIVCQSARAAIYKIDTLPVSSDPDVYNEMKSINLTLGDKEQ